MTGRGVNVIGMPHAIKPKPLLHKINSCLCVNNISHYLMLYTVNVLLYFISITNYNI